MKTSFKSTIVLAATFRLFLAVSVSAPSNKLDPSPGVGISRRITTPLIDRITLEKYRESDFAAMTLDNPHLAGAYLHVAEHIGSHIIRTNPPRDDFEWAAYEDLKKRGNAATPLLLHLCTENQYSTAEGQVISMVSYTPEISPEPFVEYCRTAIKERGMLLGPTVSYFGYFLARFGDSSDLELLRKWGRERPYVAGLVDDLIRRAAIERGEVAIPASPQNQHVDVSSAVAQTDSVVPIDWRRWLLIGSPLTLILIIILIRRASATRRE